MTSCLRSDPTSRFRHASRQIQSTSVTTPTVIAVITTTLSLGGFKIHLPNKPEMSSQGPMNIAMITNNAPPTFALKELKTCPRIMYDQAVVIPHDGQRAFNTLANEQGGNPSCSCVPWPRGSGLSVAAITSSETKPIPTPTKITRTNHRNLLSEAKSTWFAWSARMGWGGYWVMTGMARVFFCTYCGIFVAVPSQS